ncbi:MAG: hypothetical protein JO071_08760 [Deltaproteobacteria bacterium]|nr:hypothetical protein [Deltaproteobacteria bacterium]
MSTSLLCVLLIATLTGCSAHTVDGPVAGLQGVASMLAAVGSTATGLKQMQSTVDLNGANQRLIEAQAAMTQTQVEQTRDDHTRLINERKVTARLLRIMSTEYHEPLFETLAEWVEAGGDPDFAFKYALNRTDEERTAQELPHQMLLLKPRPELEPMARVVGSPQHPDLINHKPSPKQSDAAAARQLPLSTNGGE